MGRPPALAPEQTIDLTGALEGLIRDISARVPLFAHVDPGRMLVCMSTNRGARRGGCYGKLVPLRFKDGIEIMRYRGRSYAMPQVVSGECRVLYVLYFYFPRFFDLDATRKLTVIFHELYHVSPVFNGDIRRLAAAKAAHGHSRRRFDEHFARECAEYHDAIRGTAAEDFLSMDSAALRYRFARVYGRRMKVPRPVEIGR